MPVIVRSMKTRRSAVLIRRPRPAVVTIPHSVYERLADGQISILAAARAWGVPPYTLYAGRCNAEQLRRIETGVALIGADDVAIV